MRVLIAFPRSERELADAIEEELRRLASKYGKHIESVLQTSNSDEARSALENVHFTVIVLHELLPEKMSSPPSAAGGMSFIRSLRDANVAVRAALLYSSLNWSVTDLELMTNWGDAKAIRHGMDAITQIAEYVLAAKVAEPRLDISISVSNPPQPWRYRISGRNCPVPSSEGDVTFTAADLAVLKEFSEDLDRESDGGRWAKKLEILSNFLWTHLIETQSEFNGKLSQALHGIKGIEATRLRFNIGPENYPVAFEAIRPPKFEPAPRRRRVPLPYWMLGAPVFRSVNVDNEVRSSFQEHENDDHPLSCLIVLAEASGEVRYRREDGSTLDANYPSLPDARRECEALRDFFEKQSDERIRKVMFAGAERPLTNKEFRALLIDEGADDGYGWDIVHYAGHTDFIESRAYLILAGETLGTIEAVELKDLAPLLSSSRFVYLSSCHSASANFVFRLARHGVPGILGFRTKIEDELAIAHAKHFYGEFLKTLSFENAFFKTRKHFYSQALESRVWAKASLILQS